jgi:hypothetical protein
MVRASGEQTIFQLYLGAKERFGVPASVINATLRMECGRVELYYGNQITPYIQPYWWNSAKVDEIQQTCAYNSGNAITSQIGVMQINEGGGAETWSLTSVKIGDVGHEPETSDPPTHDRRNVKDSIYAGTYYLKYVNDIYSRSWQDDGCDPQSGSCYNNPIWLTFYHYNANPTYQVMYANTALTIYRSIRGIYGE